MRFVHENDLSHGAEPVNDMVHHLDRLFLGTHRTPITTLLLTITSLPQWDPHAQNTGPASFFGKLKNGGTKDMRQNTNRFNLWLSRTTWERGCYAEPNVHYFQEKGFYLEECELFLENTREFLHRAGRNEVRQSVCRVGLAGCIFWTSVVEVIPTTWLTPWLIMTLRVASVK